MKYDKRLPLTENLRVNGFASRTPVVVLSAGVREIYKLSTGEVVFVGKHEATVKWLKELAGDSQE